MIETMVNNARLAPLIAQPALAYSGWNESSGMPVGIAALGISCRPGRWRRCAHPAPRHGTAMRMRQHRREPFLRNARKHGRRACV
jgi:hypothetical protein